MLEYERLALLDPLDLFRPDGSLKPLAEMPEDARRAIAGLEIADVRFIGTGETRIESVLKKIKITDKKGALDSLAKIMGLMRDQPQQINIGINVEVAQEARERLNAKLLG
jgi:phage terminase small subunit